MEAVWAGGHAGGGIVPHDSRSPGQPGWPHCSRGLGTPPQPSACRPWSSLCWCRQPSCTECYPLKGNNHMFQGGGRVGSQACLQERMRLKELCGERYTGHPKGIGLPHGLGKSPVTNWPYAKQRKLRKGASGDETCSGYVAEGTHRMSSLRHNSRFTSPIPCRCEIC